MKSILIAIDGSEDALAATRWVVEEARTRGPLDIHLLNVQPAPIGYQTRGMEEGVIAEIAQEHGESVTEPARKLLESAGISNYWWSTEQGETARVIVEQASKAGCDTIVMGSRGPGTIGSLVLGSVATEVLHLAQVPVVLIKRAGQ
jgi:nucleotide-binding universal stress UspA family protein